MQNKTITIIILLALGASFILGILWPKFQEYKVESLKVNMKETELAYQKDYFSRLKEIESEVKKYDDDFLKIDSSFSSYFSIPGFFANIQKIAAQSGLIIENLSEFSVQGEKEIKGTKKRTFNVSVSGTYESFINFVSSVEESSKLIEIERIDFSDLMQDEANAFQVTLATHTY